MLSDFQPESTESLKLGGLKTFNVNFVNDTRFNEGKSAVQIYENDMAPKSSKPSWLISYSEGCGTAWVDVFLAYGHVILRYSKFGLIY